MKREDVLRNYGLTPQRGASTRGPIRSSLSTSAIIGQWVAFFLFGISPNLLGLVFLTLMPAPLMGISMGICFCLFGGIMGYLIAHDVNEWVEIDGDTLRWRQLFTRQVDEHHVGELAEILTLTLAVRTLTVRIVEGIYGRIKGFEFRFPDMKRGVRVFRADPAMTNVRELLEAVITKMYEFGDVEPEVIELEGSPLIRRLVLARK